MDGRTSYEARRTRVVVFGPTIFADQSIRMLKAVQREGESYAPVLCQQLPLTPARRKE